jgi:hypothetical protein
MPPPLPDSCDDDGVVVTLGGRAARFSFSPLAGLARILLESGSVAPSANIESLLRTLLDCDAELDADRRALVDTLQLAREDVARLHEVNGGLVRARDSARQRSRDLPETQRAQLAMSSGFSRKFSRCESSSRLGRRRTPFKRSSLLNFKPVSPN